MPWQGTRKSGEWASRSPLRRLLKYRGRKCKGHGRTGQGRVTSGNVWLSRPPLSMAPIGPHWQDAPLAIKVFLPKAPLRTILAL